MKVKPGFFIHGFIRKRLMIIVLLSASALILILAQMAFVYPDIGANCGSSGCDAHAFVGSDAYPGCYAYAFLSVGTDAYGPGFYEEAGCRLRSMP